MRSRLLWRDVAAVGSVGLRTRRLRAGLSALGIAIGIASMVAVLGISKFRLRVPVFEGTDDLILNRGVGWIVGTGRPGEAGNIGLAGHRDGFFRGLKDIAVGDAVELTTLAARATYVVDEIEIVSPERVDVLAPRASPSLTLVTCYPFYYVGDAPQRFIVHARLDQTVPLKPGDGADRAARAAPPR